MAIESYGKSVQGSQVSNTTISFGGIGNSIKSFSGSNKNITPGVVTKNDSIDFNNFVDETIPITEAEKVNQTDIEEQKMTFQEKMKDTTFGRFIATNVSITLALNDGSLRILERVVDGVLGSIVALGDTKTAVFTKVLSRLNPAWGEWYYNADHSTIDWAKNFIAKEWRTVEQDWLVETDYIKDLNKYSAIEYGTKTTDVITNASEKIQNTIGAILSSKVWGGMLGFLIGAVIGTGEKSEEIYRDHIDTNIIENNSVFVAGALNGLKTMSTGKSGAKLVHGFSVAKEVGATATEEVLKNTIKNEGKHILKSAVKRTATDLNNYFGTVITLYKYNQVQGYEGWELVKKSAADIATIWGSSFVGNLLEDFGNSAIEKLDNFQTDLFKIRAIEAQGNKAVTVNNSVDRASQRWLCSREEAQAILDGKVQELIDTSNIGMRASENSLRAILEDEKIKNQFEVGDSGGVYSISGRMNAEEELFGVSKGTVAEDRPIYAMALPSFDENPDYYSDYKTPGGFYGGKEGITIVFNKEKIKDCTTFTIGDSLEYADKQVGGLMSNPKYCGGFDGFADMPVEKFENASLTDLFNTDARNFRSVSDVTSMGKEKYFEFQIHGSDNHTLDVIDEVVFAGSEPGEDLIKKFQELNIKYRVIK